MNSSTNLINQPGASQTQFSNNNNSNSNGNGNGTIDSKNFHLNNNNNAKKPHQMNNNNNNIQNTSTSLLQTTLKSSPSASASNNSNNMPNQSNVNASMKRGSEELNNIASAPNKIPKYVIDQKSAS